MKLVYIADREPVKKPTKKEELMEAALLFAARSRNSLSTKRRTAKLLQIILNTAR